MAPETAWYRQFWPWMLILLPGSVVLASLTTAWIAFSAPDPVVRDEYDRNGFEVTMRLAQDQRASADGMEAELSFDPRGEARLRLRSGAPLPEALALHLVHPTDAAQDTVLMFSRTGEGLYGATSSRPLGRRYLQLEAAGDASPWRLRGILGTQEDDIARLRPGTP
jgi:hypothetical protein